MIAVVQRAFAKMEEEHCRVVTRYMGSRKCRDQESPPRDLESQRQISGSAVLDQRLESGIRIKSRTGSEIKILISFGIRDEHFR